jgi:hypothetical protein
MQNSVMKEEVFDCPRCGRVNFKAGYHELYDRDGIYTRTVADKVVDWGKCRLAAKAHIPGRPTHAEIAGCPFYKAFNGVGV